MSSNRIPKYGDIWIAYLDPITGHEQGGVRPVLVISNDSFNALQHELCIIAPLTGTDRGLPTQLLIHAPEGGIMKDSVIMCDQIRTISRQRLQSRRGSVSTETLKHVNAMVKRFLG